jgi:flagellar hook protein FlgE
MSFNTALSGLNAASADLNVKSNNIANVNTAGFKQSRAEFADVFAVSAFGSSDTAIGNGTVLNNVAQQFEQGNLDFTDNALDLGISGQGFFALAPNQTSNEIVYTRAGAFNVDSDGFVVNSAGQFLRTFPVNPDGTVSSTSITSTTALQLPSTAGTPQATANVALANNLPSTAASLTGAIDPENATTYTNATSVTIFDSLGNEHIVTLYYQKTSTVNEWDVEAYISGADIIPASTTTPVQLGVTTTLTFDPTLGGELAGASDFELPFSFSGTDFVSGAAAQTTTINFQGSTQNSGGFNVTGLTQDGFPTGRLSGLDISDDGLVRATFTNGQATPLGKIALANFSNAQGLKQIGNTSWTETLDSGQVLAGEAGTGVFGLIQSGALESSNVDLTAELVGLITAQRNFQANSKAIETNNAITQTIINLR